MTLQQLITYFRDLAQDTATPNELWSDSLLAQFANEAQVEAARRSRLFIDSSSVVTQYEVEAGDTSITLDARVIFVRKVRLASKTIPLTKIRAKDLDRYAPGWTTEAAGDTTHYCSDYETGLVYFHRPFLVADTVNLTVVREPLNVMALSVDTVSGTTTTHVSDAVDPEVRVRHQYKLVDWMLHRALNMRDIEEKYDPEAAKFHLGEFEAEFGKRSSAQDEEWIERENQYDDADGVY